MICEMDMVAALRKKDLAAGFFEMDMDVAKNMMAFDENDGFRPVEIF